MPFPPQVKKHLDISPLLRSDEYTLLYSRKDADRHSQAGKQWMETRSSCWELVMTLVTRARTVETSWAGQWQQPLDRRQVTAP